jgi:hypothetical protein
LRAGTALCGLVIFLLVILEVLIVVIVVAIILFVLVSGIVVRVQLDGIFAYYVQTRAALIAADRIPFVEIILIDINVGLTKRAT